jgi:hypothetical protein
MVKSTRVTRRTGNNSNISGKPNATAKPKSAKASKKQPERSAASPSKGQNLVDTSAVNVSPTPKKLRIDAASAMTAEGERDFGSFINSVNEHVLLAPLAIALTETFLGLDEDICKNILAYEFNDRAFGVEDPKEIDKLLKEGLLSISNQVPDEEAQVTHWSAFFNAAATPEPGGMSTDHGISMRNLGLNLAASDPLVLFDSGEFDGEGNLYSTPLSNAWIGATKTHGSIHLYFDIELQNNRLEALTFETTMNDDSKFQQYEIPQAGHPLPPWHSLTLFEKQNLRAFEYTHCLCEDPQDRCIADLRLGFQTYHQQNEKDMTVNQWMKAFINAMTPGSLIFPTSIGRELRSFGVSLALSDPFVLFLPYEWIQSAYLRPSADAHSWLGAVAVYGPL